MSVFWLAGLAGTGKSTIMKTLCQRIDNDDRFLLASFFASRNSPERRDPYAILHTFAYELAITSELLCPHVLSSLRAPQDIMQERMREQVKQLLSEPIIKAELHGRTIVLVIDALDECEKIEGVEGGRLIEFLAQALQHHPVKLLVASRQEHALEKMFRSLPHISLHLNQVRSGAVQADVWRILNEGFANIRHKHTLALQADQWPTLIQMDRLVDLTGEFFIYAATVLKFVGDSNFSPEQRLHQILQRGLVISSHFSPINDLYKGILELVTADDTGRADAELCQRVGILLRTVVLLEEPVSINALAHLMGPSGDIKMVQKGVQKLASVLVLSRPSESERLYETVSIFHPSFRDFLLDTERCSHKQFLVTPAVHQHDLLYRCLQLLNENLCYDICGIKNPGLENSEIQDLPKRLAQSVPEAVRYACRFWAVHLVAGGSLLGPVSAALREFCREHLLHWLEILSLLGDLSSAGKHLPRAAAWCQVSTSIAFEQCLINDRVI
jgi:hypothetical protein